jgi:RNA polymerase sigma-70 factor, ECF subfamily
MARTSDVGVPAVAAARRTASPSDADALFRDLHAEHGPALLRLTTVLTGGDRGRAEDLVQETMLRAWTHRDNSDFQHRSPRA